MKPEEQDTAIGWLSREETIRPCPNCESYTKQYVTLYDPDDEEGDWVWYCTVCQEGVQLI